MRTHLMYIHDAHDLVTFHTVATREILAMSSQPTCNTLHWLVTTSALHHQRPSAQGTTHIKTAITALAHYHERSALAHYHERLLHTALLEVGLFVRSCVLSCKF